LVEGEAVERRNAHGAFEPVGCFAAPEIEVPVACERRRSSSLLIALSEMRTITPPEDCPMFTQLSTVGLS
jgi:hypothetical protein